MIDPETRTVGAAATTPQETSLASSRNTPRAPLNSGSNDNSGSGKNSGTESDAQKTRNITTLLFVGFAVNGIVTVILGPILPVLIARWGLNDSQAGVFFPAQFVGSWLGTILSSALIARRGYRLPIGLGYAMLGLGVAGLISHNMVAALVATFVFGFGYGMLTPGTNLYIAETGGAQRASAVSLVNFTWGIGAVACPVLVSFALRGHHLSLVLWMVTVAGCAIAVALFLAPWDRKSGAAEDFTCEKDEEYRKIPHVGVILAALFFIYVGAETATGGWVAALAKRIANGVGTASPFVPTFFYGGLLVGRGLAPLVLRKVRENNLALMALGLAASGMLVIQKASTIPVLDVGVATAGLGLACIYPIYVAWLSHWYGERARKVGGVMFALASLGGAFAPWMVGFVSKQTGSLRIGLLVPLANVLTMIVLVYILRREIHP